MRKISSARSTIVRKWRSAFNAVVAVHRMSSLAGGLCESSLLRVGSCDKLCERAEDELEEEERLFACAAARGPGFAKNECDSLHALVREFGVGDVVRARPGGGALYFEGLLQEIDLAQRKALVHFGDLDEDPEDCSSPRSPKNSDRGGGAQSPDAEWISLDECCKVQHWNALEIGDQVEAQQPGEQLWYAGVVLEVHYSLPSASADCDDDDLRYDILWNTDETHTGDDDSAESKSVQLPDIARGLRADKVRKLVSARALGGKEKWKAVSHLVSAIALFRSSFSSDGKTTQQSVAEAKEPDPNFSPPSCKPDHK